MKVNKKIKINEKVLVSIALMYIAVPIIIFIIGWLKPQIAIISSVAILFGIVWYLKEYKCENRYLEISTIALAAIILIATAWVLLSGIGGYMPQKADWHWRNAILRDLINYTWPVIYPKTEMGLVYYFTYFLVPALVGKQFGWDAANISLVVWTVYGIVLCVFFLCKYLKVGSFKQVIGIMIIFIVWREFDDIRIAIANYFDASWCYEYSNNNTLLQWVTNQTIVPWLATLMFLNNRQISNYAFLGLCVFAMSPLPFVGFFILLIGDALVQLGKSKKKLQMIRKDFFSVQNVIALITIFPIFSTFYLLNSAATGGAGKGGVGLYMDVGYKGWIALVLFWCFNAVCFSIVIYKDYKKDHLFWITTISLIFIPIIRVGDGRDFCMRASIPGLFVMMVYVINYLKSHKKSFEVNARLIYIALGLFCYLFSCESVNSLSIAKHTENKNDYLADQVGSLGNKLPYAKCYGVCMNMYLTEDPNDKIFFSRLCEKKTDEMIEQDKYVTDNYLKSTGFEIISGYYKIYNEYAEYDIMLSNTTIGGGYQISLEGSDKVLAVGENDTAVLIDDNTEWATNNIDGSQLLTISKNDKNEIMICNNNLALTYDNGKLEWKTIGDSTEQLWKIKSNSNEISGEKFREQ